MPDSAPAVQPRSEVLLSRYRAVRAFTEKIQAQLTAEDCVVQSMPEASPVKWHLAHTTWFFETFLLEPRPEFRPFAPEFRVLFNSYYNTVGDQHPRPERGILTRPTRERVLSYRHHVDEKLADLIRNEAIAEPVLEVGIQHEQQHQELMLMDLKHLFSSNPLLPAYQPYVKSAPHPGAEVAPGLQWHESPGGLVEVGHHGGEFGFDNEFPVHQEFLRPFALANRLVTNREYLSFVEEGGYEQPDLWLSAGWDAVQESGWRAPLYWAQKDGEWFEFTLGGEHPLELDVPVCHLSYYEADAFARWSGYRLPREAEWEHMARHLPVQGNFVDQGHLHPRVGTESGDHPAQMFGDVWEWTGSPYVAYPGYRVPDGALGEYNGKFMSDQWVLRGGACVTSASHTRATYRNFFKAHERWMFSGLRLARDLDGHE